jgi:hypothetical protein
MDLKETYLGFTNNLKPMQKAKTEKLLDNVKRYNGTILSNKQFIYNELKEGSKPEVQEDVQHWSRRLGDYTKPKTEYRLRDNKEHGSYWVIEKTLYDFANYLLNNDLLDDEKVKLIITEEQAKIKLEEEEKAEQEEKQRQQAKANQEFEGWLIEQAKNYNDTKKLGLIEEIFLNETGQFGGGSIRLLVLIDNFDNPLCKNKIKSWLSYYNTASLKTFHHITGISLGKTDKEIQAKLDNITSKDFQGMIPYKKRKEKIEKGSEVYYENHFNSMTNEWEFAKREGIYINQCGLDLFITKFGKKYKITEGRSGYIIADGSTEQEALENLKNNIERIGVDKVKERIQELVERTGLSPRYQEKSA